MAERIGEDRHNIVVELPPTRCLQVPLQVHPNIYGPGRKQIAGEPRWFLLMMTSLVSSASSPERDADRYYRERSNEISRAFRSRGFLLILTNKPLRKLGSLL